MSEEHCKEYVLLGHDKDRGTDVEVSEEPSVRHRKPDSNPSSQNSEFRQPALTKNLPWIKNQKNPEATGIDTRLARKKKKSKQPSVQK